MHRANTSDLDLYDSTTIGLIVRVLYPILRWYFRADLRVPSEEIPGRTILVANHSGGMTPADWYFYTAYHKRMPGNRLYVLIHPMIARIPLLRRLLGKLGLISATATNFHRALERGASVLVYPGAEIDSLRPFSRRSEVELAGQVGFARVAVRTGCPVVPVVTAGAHETLIVLTSGVRVAARLGLPRLGVHVFPVVLCLPWIITVGPLCLLPAIPLPARIVVEIPEPIKTNQTGDSASDVYVRVQSTMTRRLKQLYADRRFPIIG